MEAVIARDKRCQFWLKVADAPHLKVTDGLCGLPKACWGPFDVHEPGHRSQGADPTDPDACVLLCRGHHDVCHREPLLAKAIGL